MTSLDSGQQGQPARPSLSAVPLFTVFGEPGTTPPRLGRVRSGFSLAAGETPPALHVVGAGEAVREAPEASAEVDWSVAAALRGTASKRFSERVTQVPSADEAARQELGRAVILEVVQEATAARFAAGGTAWSLQEQQLLAQRVFDLMFGLGRLQTLVDREDVENIFVVGNNPVLLSVVGGARVEGPPVVESDDELVGLLQDLASRANPPRVFSEAHPTLDLNLDGARLAGSAFVVHRPYVVIRRHRLVRITLDELVDMGTLSPVLASFLAAAVKARLSIVVSGEQGDGKTTLLRALCHEIGPEEVVATFETERELGLEHLPDEHPLVFSWEARPGSGELGANGRPVNEFTLQTAMKASFRYSVDRTIVGEVRGPESAEMIMAMESGSGSLSTTHAKAAPETMEKLISCAMQSGDFTRESAVMKLARCVDLIVQMKSVYRRVGGQIIKQRVVDEVLAITPGEQAIGYAAEPVFRPHADGPAIAHVLPTHLTSLSRHGFAAHDFLLEAQRHGGAA